MRAHTHTHIHTHTHTYTRNPTSSTQANFADHDSTDQQDHKKQKRTLALIQSAQNVNKIVALQMDLETKDQLRKEKI